MLLAGLDVRPGDACVSIASAGDNTLALLTKQPSRVVAIDLSAAQLACLELRVAAYRTLAHAELLELIGSRAIRQPSIAVCAMPAAPEQRRARVLGPPRPRHRGRHRRRGQVRTLLRALPPIGAAARPRSRDGRRAARPRTRDGAAGASTTRGGTPGDGGCWSASFFSRAVMARLGRERAFFPLRRSVARLRRILERTRHALVDLDPSANPYAHWILTGTHGDALPCALRPENFDTIRDNLERLEWHRVSLEEFVRTVGTGREFDRFNLSDVFEYVSPAHYDSAAGRHRAEPPSGRPARLLEHARAAIASGIARRAPASARSSRRRLHAADRAFFYSAFRMDEVVGC